MKFTAQPAGAAAAALDVVTVPAAGAGGYVFPAAAAETIQAIAVTAVALPGAPVAARSCMLPKRVHLEAAVEFDGPFANFQIMIRTLSNSGDIAIKAHDINSILVLNINVPGGGAPVVRNATALLIFAVIPAAPAPVAGGTNVQLVILYRRVNKRKEFEQQVNQAEPGTKRRMLELNNPSYNLTSFDNKVNEYWATFAHLNAAYPAAILPARLGDGSPDLALLHQASTIRRFARRIRQHCNALPPGADTPIPADWLVGDPGASNFAAGSPDVIAHLPTTGGYPDRMDPIDSRSFTDIVIRDELVHLVGRLIHQLWRQGGGPAGTIRDVIHGPSGDGKVSSI